MEINLRWPILLASNLLLLALLRLVNDGIAIWGLNVQLPGLYLLLPALSMGLTGLLLLVSVIALLIDAYSPLPLGYSLILFSIIATILYANRNNLRRATHWQWLCVVLIINMSLWLINTLWLGREWLGYLAYWQHCLTDLVTSIVLTFPVGIWFLRFQLACFRLTGQSLEEK